MIRNITSFILIQKDFDIDAQFDSGIQDQTKVAQVDPVYGALLEEIIKDKKKGFVYANYRQFL